MRMNVRNNSKSNESAMGKEAIDYLYISRQLYSQRLLSLESCREVRQFCKNLVRLVAFICRLH